MAWGVTVSNLSSQYQLSLLCCNESQYQSQQVFDFVFNTLSWNVLQQSCLYLLYDPQSEQIGTHEEDQLHHLLHHLIIEALREHSVQADQHHPRLGIGGAWAGLLVTRLSCLRTSSHEHHGCILGFQALIFFLNLSEVKF